MSALTISSGYRKENVDPLFNLIDNEKHVTENEGILHFPNSIFNRYNNAHFMFCFTKKNIRLQNVMFVQMLYSKQFKAFI